MIACIVIIVVVEDITVIIFNVAIYHSHAKATEVLGMLEWTGFLATIGEKIFIVILRLFLSHDSARPGFP